MICYFLAWSKHGVSWGVGEEGPVFSVSPLVFVLHPACMSGRGQRGRLLTVGRPGYGGSRRVGSPQDQDVLGFKFSY